MEIIRKEYTQEEKLSHIEQWQTKGVSTSGYCKEVGIAHTTFRHWLDKFHYKKVRKQTTATKQIENSSSFLAIQIQPPASYTESNKPMMELVFSSGARLNIYQTVSVDYLQQLLVLK